MAVGYSEQQMDTYLADKTAQAILIAIGDGRLRASECARVVDPFGLVPGFRSVLWDMVSRGLLDWNSDMTLSVRRVK